MGTLKRIDPDIEEVLAHAGHVCLYLMPPTTGKWERKHIEGPLFLVKRRVQPWFQLIVLNKLSTDNYVENITSDVEVEVNAPYIMYALGDEQIHGIWFSEEAELNTVHGPLERILAQLPRPGETPDGAPEGTPAPAPAPAPAPPPVPQARRGDDAFWDKAVVVDESNVPPQQFVGHNLLDGAPLDQQQALPNAPAPAADAGFHNLLRKAQQRATAKPPAQQGQALPPPPAQVAEPSPAKPAAAPLLTPSFLAAAAPEERAGVPAGGAAPASSNGHPQVPNPLQQLLNRAVKQTPAAPQGAEAAAAVPAALPAPQPYAGAAQPQPQPQPQQQAPPPQLQPPPPHAGMMQRAPPPQPPAARGPPLPPMPNQAGGPGLLAPPLFVQPAPPHVRQRLRLALGRLLQSDAFVDALALELYNVDLLKM